VRRARVCVVLCSMVCCCRCCLCRVQITLSLLLIPLQSLLIQFPLFGRQKLIFIVPMLYVHVNVRIHIFQMLHVTASLLCLLCPLLGIPLAGTFRSVGSQNCLSLKAGVQSNVPLMHHHQSECMKYICADLQVSYKLLEGGPCVAEGWCSNGSISAATGQALPATIR
jgi:hypothetical protein